MFSLFFWLYWDWILGFTHEGLHTQLGTTHLSTWLFRQQHWNETNQSPTLHLKWHFTMHWIWTLKIHMQTAAKLQAENPRTCLALLALYHLRSCFSWVCFISCSSSSTFSLTKQKIKRDSTICLSPREKMDRLSALKWKMNWNGKLGFG